MICVHNAFISKSKSKRAHNNHAFVHLINSETELPGCYLKRMGSMTNRSLVSIAESEAAFNGLPIFCDLCESYLAPSNGGRFKCMVCDNYDLCAACFAQGTHDNHAFVHVNNGATDFTGFNIGKIRGLNSDNQQNNSHPIMQNAVHDNEAKRRYAILSTYHEKMQRKYSEMATQFETIKQERADLAARDEERERKLKETATQMEKIKQERDYLAARDEERERKYR
ncbi:hypothetical protein PRIPAC_73379, partial [Pristionchus pacificus]|uniref:ZZ-type domain-containing protein n=1 Tax=Pristionchus pacificus TaxID=54126 RepID=A0A8R1V7H1_PRIPA